MIKTIYICDVCDAEFEDLVTAEAHTTKPVTFEGYKPGLCFEVMDGFPHYAVIIDKLQKPNTEHIVRYEILFLPAIAIFLPYQDTRVRNQVISGDQLKIETIPDDKFLADQKDIERWVKKTYAGFNSEITNKE